MDEQIEENCIVHQGKDVNYQEKWATEYAASVLSAIFIESTWNAHHYAGNHDRAFEEIQMRLLLLGVVIEYHRPNDDCNNAVEPEDQTVLVEHHEQILPAWNSARVLQTRGDFIPKMRLQWSVISRVSHFGVQLADYEVRFTAIEKVRYLLSKAPHEQTYSY